jgi:hypothetical protein
MKKSIPFLFASILFFAASCKKDDPLNTDKLPPATTSGKNTFGCKVNGEVWIAHIEGGGIFDDPIYAKHYLAVNHPILGDCDQLLVVGKRKYDEQADISQQVSVELRCPKLGENQLLFNKGAFLDFRICNQGYRYALDTLSPCTVFITRLDSINFIASGTFEFTAINDDCKDTLRITEGRFDVNTRP